MFRTLGVPELLIVLVIIVLLFGVGRIGKISSEIGNAIRQFRDSLQEKDEPTKSNDVDEKTDNK